MNSQIDRIEALITELSLLNSKALTQVSPDESHRLQKHIHTLDRDILDSLDETKNLLVKATESTKRNPSSRVKSQQRSVARRLQASITRYSLVQGKAQQDQKSRIRREIKIARPDWRYVVYIDYLAIRKWRVKLKDPMEDQGSTKSFSTLISKISNKF